MQLTQQQIKALATGYVETEERGGLAYFAKCTKKQRDFWYSQSDSLGQRAETTTGILLDFTTDSKNIALKVTKDVKFELKINGNIIQQTTDGLLSGTLSGKDRVTVVFPRHSVGFIESLELDDGAYFKPVDYKTKILFIGDSITQGWNSKYDSLCYAQRVVDFFDAKAVCNGIGGSYFAKGSFDKIDFEPDTVVVAYGCNDFKHYKTMEERTKNADGFLKEVATAYAGKQLIYVLPIPRLDVEGQAKAEFERMRENFRDIAAAYGFEILDGFNIIPASCDFFADALHPNDLGFSTYADNLIKKIGK